MPTLANDGQHVPIDNLGEETGPKRGTEETQAAEDTSRVEVGGEKKKQKRTSGSDDDNALMDHHFELFCHDPLQDGEGGPLNALNFDDICNF